MNHFIEYSITQRHGSLKKISPKENGYLECTVLVVFYWLLILIKFRNFDVPTESFLYFPQLQNENTGIIHYNKQQAIGSELLAENSLMLRYAADHSSQDGPF